MIARPVKAVVCTSFIVGGGEAGGKEEAAGQDEV